MQATHPDIVVVGPDGEYLIVVEIKLNDNAVRRRNAIVQLKNLMAA